MKADRANGLHREAKAAYAVKNIHGLLKPGKLLDSRFRSLKSNHAGNSRDFKVFARPKVEAEDVLVPPLISKCDKMMIEHTAMEPGDRNALRHSAENGPHTQKGPELSVIRKSESFHGCNA